MPYDRIRGRRGEDLEDQEQLEARAASFQESVRVAKELCIAGGCQREECEGGRRCPFARTRP